MLGDQGNIFAFTQFLRGGRQGEPQRVHHAPETLHRRFARGRSGQERTGLTQGTPRRRHRCRWRAGVLGLNSRRDRSTVRGSRGVGGVQNIPERNVYRVGLFCRGFIFDFNLTGRGTQQRRETIFIHRAHPHRTAMLGSLRKDPAHEQLAQLSSGRPGVGFFGRVDTQDAGVVTVDNRADDREGLDE